MSVLRVAIVGAGPQGTAVLARLVARAAALPTGYRMQVDVVEPTEPGAGPVWGTGQSPELLMNSPVESADFFPPPSSGTLPAPNLPSLAQWLGARLDAPRDASCPGFAPRAVVGRYLGEVFGVLQAAHPAVRVTVHRAVAIRLATGGNREQILLSNGQVLEVGAVVLTQGHLPVGPTEPEQAMLAAAARGGWTYHPPGPSSAVAVDSLAPGAAVAVRGFGLAAVDLIAVLTRGRGGEFDVRPDGRLRYRPSGREPVLYVGSRRGLPHRGKPPSGTAPAPLEPAQFLTAQAVTAHGAPLDFGRHVWPLIRAEVVAAYYRQVRLLGAWDPRIGLDPLVQSLRRHGPDSDAVRQLIARAVADRRFRDPDAWWRGRRPGDGPEDIRHAIHADLGQVRQVDFLARLAARAAFIRAAGSVAALEVNGWINSRTLVDDVDRWFWPMSSGLTSGPPRGRLEQLLALIDSGIVRPVGGGMAVSVGRAGPLVSGTSAPRPFVVTAVVEARLPRPDLARVADPLVAGLLTGGQAREVILQGGENALPTGFLATDGCHRLLDSGGRPHPRRWALGPSVRVVDRTADRAPFHLPSPAQSADAVSRDVVRRLVRDTAPGAPDVFAPPPTTAHSIV